MIGAALVRRVPTWQRGHGVRDRVMVRCLGLGMVGVGVRIWVHRMSHKPRGGL